MQGQANPPCETRPNEYDKRQSNRQAVQRYRQKKKGEYTRLQAENDDLRKQVQDLKEQLELVITSTSCTASTNQHVMITSEEYEELQMLRAFKLRATVSMLHRDTSEMERNQLVDRDPTYSMGHLAHANRQNVAAQYPKRAGRNEHPETSQAGMQIILFSH